MTSIKISQGGKNCIITPWGIFFMKKFSITFILLSIIILLVAVGANFTSKTKTEYLRIHVRANSNQAVDQNVKYELKDKIVDYLTPYIANVNTKSGAISLLNDKKSTLQNICNAYLVAKGFTYKAKVSIKQEYFPTRIYDDLTLDAGYYDAIIVELGKGEGDNWWCVVYPPLCFVENAPVKYRSKLLEIINKFKN